MSEPHPGSINIEEVRKLTRNASRDRFFLALVDSMLSKDRMADDELMDILFGNPMLQDIYHELFDTEAGRARVRKSIRDVLPDLEGPCPSDFACQRVWTLAAADPRFALIVKQALDDVRVAPRRVQPSSLGAIAKILDKIRQALSSANAGHSSGTLLAAILAALLAGGTAARYIPNGDNASGSSAHATADATARLDGVVAGLNGVAHEIHQQTKAGCNTCKLYPPANYEGRIHQLEIEYGILANRQTPPNSKWTVSFDNSFWTQLTGWAEKRHKVNGPIGERHEDFINVEASLKDIHSDLQKINDPSLLPLAGLAASASSISTSLGPINAQSPDVIPINQAIAKTNARLAAFLGDQPRTLQLEMTFERNVPVLLKVQTSAEPACTVSFTLIAVNRSHATLTAAPNKCGITPGDIVVDQQRKRLRREVIDTTQRHIGETDEALLERLQTMDALEFRFQVPYKSRIWPLRTHGASLAIYSAARVTRN